MPANGGTTGELREAAQARTSRRNMLRRGGVAAAATVAGLTLLDQRRAEATTGNPLLLGEANDANATTTLAVTGTAVLLSPLFHVSAAGLTGTSTTMVVDGPGAPTGRALVVNGGAGGAGIVTSASNTAGTVGLALAASGSNGSDAIHASSDKGSAVVAASTTGRGVLATSHSNAAVSGGSATGVGVAGTSGSGAGVTGKGHIGGLFNGTVANLRLTPQAGAHPASGSKGDLFVDHNAHLWFCRGGTSWVRLA
jgi:hypothetical protein